MVLMLHKFRSHFSCKMILLYSEMQWKTGFNFLIVDKHSYFGYTFLKKSTTLNKAKHNFLYFKWHRFPLSIEHKLIFHVTNKMYFSPYIKICVTADYNNTILYWSKKVELSWVTAQFGVGGWEELLSIEPCENSN